MQRTRLQRQVSLSVRFAPSVGRTFVLVFSLEVVWCLKVCVPNHRLNLGAARSQMALVPAPLVPKARATNENDERWAAPAAQDWCPPRLWPPPPPPTRHAYTRWRLSSKSIMRAAPPAAHTRHPLAWVLTEHKPHPATQSGAALCGSSGHVVQLNTSWCHPSARAPCLPHAARLGLRNVRAE